MLACKRCMLKQPHEMQTFKEQLLTFNLDFRVADATTATSWGAPSAGHTANNLCQLKHIGAAQLELAKPKLAVLNGGVVTNKEINLSTRRLVHIASVQGQQVYGWRALNGRLTCRIA